VVGGHGALLAYRDGKWSQETPLTDETLYDVVVTKSRRGWAVGTNGTLLSYNGTTWEKVAVSTSADLSGVGLSDENRGWAVGDRGTLIRYDGSTWMVSADSPISDKVHKVFAINDVDAWGVCSYGNLIHYNGMAWSAGAEHHGAGLYGVWMNDSQDGWAVGRTASSCVTTAGPLGPPARGHGQAHLERGGVRQEEHRLHRGAERTLLKFQPGASRGAPTCVFSRPSRHRERGGAPHLEGGSSTCSTRAASPWTGVELQAILPKGCSPVKSAP
jgi:hypothetical protein